MSAPVRDELGQFVKGQPAYNRKEHIRKECPECGTVFHVKPSLDRVTCCSRSCAGKKRIRECGHPMEGRKHRPESRAKQSAAKRGNGGPGHWNYKHGQSKYYRERKGSPEHVAWRTSVFERDDYTCQECGERGCHLEAHHIKGWAHHPDLRFDVENGVTVCRPCHAAIDKHRAQFLKVGGSNF